MIQEPMPFSPRWYSHKFKSAGLRYEVGVGIANGHIVWSHGPFPCGEYNDLAIFRLRMKQSLLPEEKVVSDAGYQDERCSANSTSIEANNWGYVRARHEAVNKRLKQFNVLGRKFRHNLSPHGDCFNAVCNLTQLMIERGEPVFDC